MKSNLFLLIIAGLGLHASGQVVNYRLPNSVIPSHYDVHITTDLTAFTFWGHVVINVQINQPNTNTIVLHSRDLTINNITVTLGAASLYQGHQFNNATDFLTINLNQVVAPLAALIVTIHFNGVLSTGNVGYYRASYVNELNQTRFMAITHLEATNARRVFPCFDQPNFKATFQITLIRNNQFITASNTRILNQLNLVNNMVQDTYATTPVMSTYLVAFMVSDYSHVANNVSAIEYRTFGRSEFIQRGEGSYSLAVAPQVMDALTNFTAIPYPLDTMDQVPVPNEYFRIGAMENWGMITYRERYLMYNPQLTTSSERQFIATIISHEFAHQWFGNLVTPQWWNYIWLNEGFATYLEIYITSLINPAWQLMDQFVTSIVQPVFEEDSLPTTRPMTRAVESPAEIDAQYDKIVYEKAGSVIRMAANFLGDTAFIGGLRMYLALWQNQNASPQNLYQAWQLTQAENLNITAIMSSWELQAGYPVVTVTRNGNDATLTQQRFLLNGATDNTLWHIPLTWMTPTGISNGTYWLTAQSVSVTFQGINVNQWVLFNVNQMGYYRVNYDANNWLLLINQLRELNFNAIPVINRAQLIDDSFNLARSGRLNFSVAFDIGAYIFNETEYVPIRTFVRTFNHLDRLFTGRPQFNQIRDYGIGALQGYFNRSGFVVPADNHLTRLTKVEVLTWLCRLGHTPCVNNAQQLFNAWIAQNTAIDQDVQNYVYCQGMRNSNMAAWETMLQRYVALRQDTQRTRIAQALACSTDSAILQRLLAEIIMNNSVIARSDKLVAITSLYSNNGIIGVNTLLHWLLPNFQVLNERVGNVAPIIKGVSDRITTNDQVNAFNVFVDAHRSGFTPAVNETVNTASVTVQDNLLWINQASPGVTDHFGGAATTVFCQIFLLIGCVLLSFYMNK